MLPISQPTPARTTRKGYFRVYYKDEDACPDLHDDEGGPWYFEPGYWNTGGVGAPFSIGFATQEVALREAEVWEARSEQCRGVELGFQVV